MLTKITERGIVGHRYGRLVIIGFVQGQHQMEVLCKCDCGQETNLSLHRLKKGLTVSCGCYKKELTIKKNTVHGQNKKGMPTPEYKAWAGMKTRCYSEKYYLYHRYGGRGIKVCDRWLNSFESFFEDMGIRPSNKHSLDRFPDNNGDYGPSNCRWATQKQQGRNQSTNVLVDINGEIKTVSEWAEIHGIHPKLAFGRIYKGWDVVKSIITPARKFQEALEYIEVEK